MINRRKFIHASVFTSLAGVVGKEFLNLPTEPVVNQPVVVSTWDAGLEANKGAWEVLGKGGRALDAVEKGVMVTEASKSCCVGLQANPDRDGFVTLDACIWSFSVWCCVFCVVAFSPSSLVGFELSDEG